MARQEWSNPVLSSPAWCGDYGERLTLIPGGARLKAADFTADASGKKPVRSGTLVGRTRTERDAGVGFGPYASGDEEVYLLWQDVTDAVTNPDCDLYRHGALVKTNFLPTQDNIAVVRQNYETTVGVN